MYIEVELKGPEALLQALDGAGHAGRFTYRGAELVYADLERSGARAVSPDEVARSYAELRAAEFAELVSDADWEAFDAAMDEESKAKGRPADLKEANRRAARRHDARTRGLLAAEWLAEGNGSQDYGIVGVTYPEHTVVCRTA